MLLQRQQQQVLHHHHQQQQSSRHTAGSLISSSSSRPCPAAFKPAFGGSRPRMVCAAEKQQQQQQKSAREELRKMEGDRVRLRAEAEAPWRSLRLTLSGFSVASAGMGALICIPQLIGALGGAPGALPLRQVLENIGIDLGAVGLFAFLFSRDWQARDRQVARLAREEALAAQQVRLANGKRLRLGDLQGTSRIVLAAGTPQQVCDALAAAEPYKEQLLRRGVLVVPLPIFTDTTPSSSSSSSGSSSGGGEHGSPASDAIPPPGQEDLRWRVTAINPDGWRAWFDQQLATTKATPVNGLFIGLRLDGRTRASGMGPPPWARFAVELAPLEGEDKWSGFWDGFDGKI